MSSGDEHDEGSAGSGDGEMLPRRQLTRETRGKRMSKLIGEELEKSNQFWSQAASLFEEVEDDESYASSESDSDIVDSDFDAPEDQGPEKVPEEEVDREEQAERKRKKAGAYVDIARARSKRVKIVAPKRSDSEDAAPAPARSGRGGRRASTVSDGAGAGAGTAAAAAAEAAPKPKRGRGRPPRAAVSPAGVSSAAESDASSAALRVRASTRRKTELAHKYRQQEEERLSRRGGRRRGHHDHRELTREELLEEAKRTEQINTASLAQLTALEEELKRKRAPPTRKEDTGPLIRVTSRLVDGHPSTCISFVGMSALPAAYCAATAPPYPVRSRCVVTGQPARYRDPQSGLPYADAQAFRELRSLLAAGRTPPYPPTFGATASAAVSRASAETSETPAPVAAASDMAVNAMPVPSAAVVHG